MPPCQAGSGAHTELREPPVCSSRIPCGGCFCLRGRPGSCWNGMPRSPAQTPGCPRPPAPSRRVFARGLCVLCVAQRRGRGAFPVPPLGISRAALGGRRRIRIRVPAAATRPLPPARPRGRWEALAPPTAAFVTLVASPNDSTLGAPSADASTGCGARPPGCPVGSGSPGPTCWQRQKFPRRSAFPRFAAWQGLPWTAAVSQGQGQPSSANISRAGSKGHLRLGSCGRSETHIT